MEYNTLLGARESKLAGASKYGCRYQPKWEQEFPFINRGIQDSVYISFYCKVCQRDTSCHQGITDLKGHENSAEERVFFQWCEKTRIPFAQTLGSTKHCQACLLSNWQLMSLATNMNPRTHCKARKVTWVYNKEHRKS